MTMSEIMRLREDYAREDAERVWRRWYVAMLCAIGAGVVIGWMVTR